MAAFAQKLRVLALDGQKRFEGFQYDVEVKGSPLAEQQSRLAWHVLLENQKRELGEDSGEAHKTLCNLSPRRRSCMQF